MKTKKLTLASLLTAIGVVAGNVIFIPVGVSKCFPVQHVINVLAAVVLGPAYGAAIAFCISLLRNISGTGTLLAFPGSMIGAFIAGMAFKKSKSLLLTAIGEVFGTGILGGILAFPVAKFIMGKNVGAFAFVAPFLVSTVGGSIIGYILVKSLKYSKLFNIAKEG